MDLNSHLKFKTTIKLHNIEANYSTFILTKGNPISPFIYCGHC